MNQIYNFITKKLEDNDKRKPKQKISDITKTVE